MYFKLKKWLQAMFLNFKILEVVYVNLDNNFREVIAC